MQFTIRWNLLRETQRFFQGCTEMVYDTERQLLYVACTRARDRLLISAVEPASEFLDDVRA
jgi:superfamily I DNA/RNA helicase